MGAVRAAARRGRGRRRGQYPAEPRRAGEPRGTGHCRRRLRPAPLPCGGSLKTNPLEVDGQGGRADRAGAAGHDLPCRPGRYAAGRGWRHPAARAAFWAGGCDPAAHPDPPQGRRPGHRAGICGPRAAAPAGCGGTACSAWLRGFFDTLAADAGAAGGGEQRVFAGAARLDLARRGGAVRLVAGAVLCAAACRCQARGCAGAGRGVSGAAVFGAAGLPARHGCLCQRREAMPEYTFQRGFCRG